MIPFNKTLEKASQPYPTVKPLSLHRKVTRQYVHCKPNRCFTPTTEATGNFVDRPPKLTSYTVFT